jgi:hypothetical protein
MVGGGGPMARLPQLISRNHALEVLLSSEDIRGDQAKAYSYVLSHMDAELVGTGALLVIAVTYPRISARASVRDGRPSAAKVLVERLRCCLQVCCVQTAGLRGATLHRFSLSPTDSIAAGVGPCRLRPVGRCFRLMDEKRRHPAPRFSLASAQGGGSASPPCSPGRQESRRPSCA